MTKYGLIRADGTQRPAYFKASRWNDGVKRHTLYTCCGTFANAWGFNNGMRTGVDGVPITSLLSLGVKDPFPATVNNVPGGVPITMVPSGSFDALVGAAANPHLFNWCPIPYPATAPISLTSLGSPPEQTGPLISLGQSISVGVAEVTRHDAGALGNDFADAVFVGLVDANIGTRQRATDRAWNDFVAGPRDGEHRRGFGHAVAFE